MKSETEPELIPFEEALGNLLVDYRATNPKELMAVLKIELDTLKEEQKEQKK